MSKLELSLQDNIIVNVKTGEIGVFLLPRTGRNVHFYTDETTHTLQ